MSLVNYTDPRVDYQSPEENNTVVQLGGQLYSYEVIPSDGGVNQSKASWSVSPNTIEVIDRKIYVRSYVEFTFDNAAELGVNSAPRALPLHSVMENLELRLNGNPVSTQPSEYIHAFMSYGYDSKTRERCLSMTPAFPDQYNDYADWADVEPAGSGGSYRNPLAGFGESNEPHRGGFPYVSLSVDKKTVRYIFTEPLFVSPLVQCGENSDGLVNINKLQVNIRWKGDLARMWSESQLSPSHITTVTASFYQAPELLITRITPNLLSQKTDIPCQVQYHYDEPQTYIKTASNVATLATVTARSDTIKLSQIPNGMLVFARRDRADATFLTSDNFGRLDRLKILFNNRDIMSGASPQQIYQIAKKNGYNQSWHHYNRYLGAPVFINFATDVGLPDGLAPSVRTQATLTVEADVTNLSKNTINYEFFVVLIQGGVISINENSSIVNLGNLCKEEVMMAQQPGALKITHHDVTEKLGKGLWGDVKHFFNGVSRGVQTVAPVASRLFPALSPEIGAINTIAGTVRRNTGGSIAGGSCSGSHAGQCGGNREGCSSSMSRRFLRNR